MNTVTIGARFNGPDGSANGGYACGAVASLVEGPARVRLSRPPPLDRALEVRTGESAGEVRVFEGEHLVATAVPYALKGEAPAAPSLEQARAGQQRYRGLTGHIYPRCFVCGPERDHGDGLRIFAGAVPEREGLVASEWQPTPEMRNEQGHVDPRMVWAALDCPSYFALDVDPGRGFLLGQMAAQLQPEIPGDAPMVVYAWAGPRDRRKHHAAAALADAEGRVWARAEHVWIELTAS
ncbi:MAG: hypothetical protein AAF799_45015 [Myxococcota bacterium]